MHSPSSSSSVAPKIKIKIKRTSSSASRLVWSGRVLCLIGLIPAGDGGFAFADVLEVGDEDEGDDDEQGPGADLSRGDGGPCVLLVGVDPRAKEGGHVFGNPDEKADEQKAQDERHGALA